MSSHVGGGDLVAEDERNRDREGDENAPFGPMNQSSSDSPPSDNIAVGDE